MDVAKRRELIRRAFVVLEGVWHHLYQDVLFRALEVSHETSNNLCIAIQQLYCAWDGSGLWATPTPVRPRAPDGVCRSRAAARVQITELRGINSDY